MRLVRLLQWRITFVFGILLVASIAIASSFMANLASDTYRNDLDERLEQEARLLGDALEDYLSGRKSLLQVQEQIERDAQLIGADVTVVGADGTVLADSSRDRSGQPNLRGRPEIAEAFATGISRRRAADGPDGSLIYYTAAAIDIAGGRVGVARLAIPVPEIDGRVGQILRSVVVYDLLISLIAAAAVYFLARQMSRSVHLVASGARKLAGGDLDHRIVSEGFDETRELADAFNQMATNLRGMLEKLSSDRGRLSLILDAMADGVLLIANDGTIRDSNPTAARLLRVAGHGEGSDQAIDAVEDPGMQSVIAECLAARGLVQREVSLPGGPSLSVIAIPLPGDPSPNVLLTMHDLTRIRQLESSQKEFVSNVSHELRSPLASIAAIAEALETGALDEPDVARDFVRRIQDETGRMSVLVDDLLELSRLETQTRLQVSPVDLRRLLEEIHGQLGERAQDKGVALTYELPDEVPMVAADKERLRRVFVNLLDNAIKFTPAGGEVAVAVIVHLETVEAAVRDTGIGIPDEHREHIFERFYKVDSSRSGGTGLGLAIARQIIEAHGGEIRVQSSRNGDTTFSVTVPRMR